MLAAFWLVWVDAPFIELRGFQIPLKVGDAVDFIGGARDEAPARWKRVSLWTLYAVPVAAIVGAVAEYFDWRRGGNLWWARLIAALVPLAALAAIATTFATQRTWFQAIVEAIPEGWLPSPWEVLDVGFWVTAGGASACLASVFTSRNKKGAAVQAAPSKHSA
jgi:hypothetical protein